MRRWSNKADANQRAIMKSLRAAGASVVSLGRVGEGVPDLLVGYRGVNYLLEVKEGSSGLNTVQAAWRAGWRGHAAIVRCPDDALREIGAT